jgi:hypothetical protein
MKTCGFEKQINPYLDGELSGEKLRAFEAHLEDCPKCRREVEQFRGLLNELHGLQDLEVPPMLKARIHDALAKETLKGDGRVKRKVNPWALSAIAAAVVVLFGGVALLGGAGVGVLHNAIQNDSLSQKNISGRAPMAAATAAPQAAPLVDAGRGLPIPEPTAAATMNSQGLSNAGDESLADKAGNQSLVAPNFSSEQPAAGKAAGDNPTQQPGTSRKIIYTAYLVVESRDYDKCVTTVESLYARLGGYKANSQENGVPDASDAYAARTAVFSLRIPIDKYDAAMAELKAMGNVLSSSEGTEDVSRQYVDTEARNKTLKEERDKLYDLLAKAESMDSIIALQNQITQLTTEIEQETAQLNFWDDQVSYSTITVEIHELVTPKTVKSDPDMNARVNSAFYNTLNNMKKGLENFAVDFVGFLPWLAIIVVVAGIASAVILPVTAKARRAARKKAAESKKEE